MEREGLGAFAAQNAHFEVLRWLLARAAETGHLKVLQWLHEHRAQVLQWLREHGGP